MTSSFTTFILFHFLSSSCFPSLVSYHHRFSSCLLAFGALRGGAPPLRGVRRIMKTGGMK